METKIETYGPDETARLGRLIGSSASPPRLVLLKGDLGSGKTLFAKAFAEGIGSTDETSSPSFAIANSYSSPKGPVNHLDLYRIGDAEELRYIGLEDYLEGAAATLIEWPEVAGLDESADLIVSFSVLGPERREIVFSGDFEVSSILESFQKRSECDGENGSGDCGGRKRRAHGRSAQ